jgi:hypothetical protein
VTIKHLFEAHLFLKIKEEMMVMFGNTAKNIFVVCVTM